jgi:hypothetical protein
MISKSHVTMDPKSFLSLILNFFSDFFGVFWFFQSQTDFHFRVEFPKKLKNDQKLGFEKSEVTYGKKSEVALTWQKNRNSHMAWPKNPKFVCHIWVASRKSYGLSYHFRPPKKIFKVKLKMTFEVSFRKSRKVG